MKITFYMFENDKGTLRGCTSFFGPKHAFHNVCAMFPTFGNAKIAYQYDREITHITGLRSGLGRACKTNLPIGPRRARRNNGLLR